MILGSRLACCLFCAFKMAIVGDLKGYFNFHVDKCKVFQKYVVIYDNLE